VIATQFLPIPIEPPKVPGGDVLRVPFDAIGRFEEVIAPPVLIMATLRALNGKRAKQGGAPAMWLLEIEGDYQAQRDLLEAAISVGLCEINGSWFEEMAGVKALEALRPIGRDVAMAKLWRLCSQAVLTDTKALGETPSQTIERLTSEFQAIDRVVSVERARRREIVERDWLTSGTWPFPAALWWTAFRSIASVIDGPSEFERAMPGDPWRYRIAFECAAHPSLCVERAPYQTLLRECRRTPGLLLGVRIGGVGLEAIDPRLMEGSFALDDDGEIATAPGGLRWEGVCFDVPLLLKVIPPLAATPSAGTGTEKHAAEHKAVIAAAEKVAPNGWPAWSIDNKNRLDHEDFRHLGQKDSGSGRTVRTVFLDVVMRAVGTRARVNRELVQKILASDDRYVDRKRGKKPPG
jgi:hypothetical protein